ncbi:MAG: hypothetical protein HQM15_11330 [Deltaproteobacteria bacterium]|nr:hypothetical protein [Deltaproteobacteria bacterium]
MNNISIQAHFDGRQILLDEPVQLEPNVRLIVTVLPKQDEDHQSWLYFSSLALERAYDEKEEEYPLNLIKEVNPEYEGR